MKRRGILVALLLLGIAALLRLHGLWSWSLDGDEIYSWYDVQRVLAGGEWPFGMRTHPLGYLAMAGSVRLFGLSEGVLRVVPALAGVGAVATLIWMRRDGLPRRVGLAAAGLAALSPWLIYASQTARFYAPQLLFASLATLLWLPGPRRRPGWALAALGAAVLCHPSAVFLVPVFLFPLLGPPLRWRALLLLALAGSAAAALLWITDDGALALVLGRVLSALDPTHYDPTHFVLGLGYNLGPVTGLLAGLGALGALRSSGRPGQPPRVLLAFALIPPVILLGLALCGISAHQRYATAALPGLLLLAGFGLDGLFSGSRRLGWAGLLLATLAYVPGLLAYAGDGDRHDARLAAAVLAERLSPHDLVVVDEHSTLQLYLQRHAGLSDVVLVEDTLVDARKRRDFLGNRHQVWVLLKASRLAGAYDPDLTRWVDEYFTEVTSIGRHPPALVRHDNRYVLFRRKRRVFQGRRRTSRRRWA